MEEIKEQLKNISMIGLKVEDKPIIVEILECLNKKNLTVSKCSQILDLTKRVLPLVVILK